MPPDGFAPHARGRSSPRSAGCCSPPAAGAWTLTPLPGSDGFKAEIDLAAFGAPGASVATVDALEPTEGAAPPTWHQDGNVLTLAADARAFAYRITFKK